MACCEGMRNGQRDRAFLLGTFYKLIPKGQRVKYETYVRRLPMNIPLLNSRAVLKRKVPSGRKIEKTRTVILSNFGRRQNVCFRYSVFCMCKLTSHNSNRNN